MSRYIDADKVLKIVNDMTECEDDYERITEWVHNMPSIDIVLCKDCKHRPIKEDADGADYGFNVIAPNTGERCPCLVEDGWYSWMPEDDFHCGYGEREGE